MSLNLDEEVRRLALMEARKYVAQGSTIDEAVTQACRGGWTYQQKWVRKELQKIMREAFGKKS